MSKHTPHLGDHYQSNDPREHTRTVEIGSLESEHARVFNIHTHRTSKVSYKSLDTTAQRGYHLVSCVVEP